MHPVLAKTLGGLSREYYFRQIVFGVAFCVFMLFWVSGLGTHWSRISFGTIATYAVCTVLYPYSRFVYDSIVGFVMGSTVIALPLPIMLLVKLAGMMLCFLAAIFIAPVGLAYLYWRHSKQQS